MGLDEEFQAKYPTLRCGYCGWRFGSHHAVIPDHQAELSIGTMLSKVIDGTIGDDEPSDMN